MMSFIEDYWRRGRRCAVRLLWELYVDNMRLDTDIVGRGLEFIEPSESATACVDRCASRLV